MRKRELLTPISSRMEKPSGGHSSPLQPLATVIPIPVTTLGRSMAVILMFFGLGIIGVLSSYLSTTFISLDRRRREAGKDNNEVNDDQEKDDSTSRDAELAAIREELAALRKLFEEHYQSQ